MRDFRAAERGAVRVSIAGLAVAGESSFTATFCRAIDDATVGVHGAIGRGALIDALAASASDIFEARLAGALNADVRVAATGIWVALVSMGFTGR